MAAWPPTTGTNRRRIIIIIREPLLQTSQMTTRAGHVGDDDVMLSKLATTEITLLHSAAYSDLVDTTALSVW